MYCSKCGKELPNNANFCSSCGNKIVYTQSIQQNYQQPMYYAPPQQYYYQQPIQKQFNGVYRYKRGKQIEVYCPRCNSENCSHYKEQEVIPAKVKKSTSLNLNPLKPFTPFNHKEKIIREEIVNTKDRFLCNKCGKIFD